MNAEREHQPGEADEQRVDIRDVLGRRIWRSDELFRGDKEVIILHGDEIYRLRQTRHGKLILQK